MATHSSMKKDSPSLSRVTSGNSGLPRLVPVTSGSFSGLMGFAGVAQGFGVARTPLSRAWEEPEEDGVGS